MTNRFDCTQEDCHFSVASDDEGEVIHVVREHAQDRHGMSVSDKDVRKGMQVA
jgi:predicted small metal-binding protein